jgi:DNA ligase-4
VAEQFRRADVSGVKEVSKVFEGKEFCVVNAPRELSKQDMERKIVEVN